jgi:hypothetical protein
MAWLCVIYVNDTQDRKESQYIISRKCTGGRGATKAGWPVRPDSFRPRPSLKRWDLAGHFCASK